MVKGENVFVFVVCGDRQYTDSLSLAIQSLKKKSRSRILVVTDSRRNQDMISGAEVMDVETPSELNHHQASVFLKTSVNRYVRNDHGLCCYLDSDIITSGDLPDDVFSHYRGIIGFAEDHLSLDLFSPYAVQCNCLNESRSKESLLHQAQNGYAEIQNSWHSFTDQSGGRDLQAIIAETRRLWMKNAAYLGLYMLKLNLPMFRKAPLKAYYFDKKENAWYDPEGRKILYPLIPYYEYIHQKTGFSYDKKGCFWFDGSRQDVCIPCCHHLHQQIEKESGIKIRPADWQHWNGGMFVFSKDSDDFLDSWHDSTMRIFKDPAWRTRDQGTLAMTAWKFGLQKTRLIPSVFNYIVDSGKAGLVWGERGVSRDHGKTWDRPQMMHIYHRFGDESWDFWQFIKQNYL